MAPHGLHPFLAVLLAVAMMLARALTAPPTHGSAPIEERAASMVWCVRVYSTHPYSTRRTYTWVVPDFGGALSVAGGCPSGATFQVAHAGSVHN